MSVSVRKIPDSKERKTSKSRSYGKTELHAVSVCNEDLVASTFTENQHFFQVHGSWVHSMHSRLYIKGKGNPKRAPEQ